MLPTERRPGGDQTVDALLNIGDDRAENGENDQSGEDLSVSMTWPKWINR